VITLEQVKLLESKINRTIDFIGKLSGENTALKGKLDAYQKRITELEVLIKRFKNDQSRIEDTILSALDRLNKFEDVVEVMIPKESTIPTESTNPTEAKLPAETPIPKNNEARSEPEAPPEPEKTPKTGELDIY